MNYYCEFFHEFSNILVKLFHNRITDYKICVSTLIVKFSVVCSKRSVDEWSVLFPRWILTNVKLDHDFEDDYEDGDGAGRLEFQLAV